MNGRRSTPSSRRFGKLRAWSWWAVACASAVLEKRIGRTLTAKDFVRGHPFNSLPGTKRLLARREQWARTGLTARRGCSSPDRQPPMLPARASPWTPAMRSWTAAWHHRGSWRCRTAAQVCENVPEPDTGRALAGEADTTDTLPVFEHPVVPHADHSHRQHGVILADKPFWEMRLPFRKHRGGRLGRHAFGDTPSP